MQDIAKLLLAHHIQSEKSCVAWGYEFIAKWHGKLAWDEFPLQKEFPAGLGFGDDERNMFLARFGIGTRPASARFEALKDLIQREARSGYPPILSIFSRGTIVYGEKIGIYRDSHIFVGLEDSDQYLFGSRVLDSSEILWLWLPHVRTIQEISAKLPLPREEIDLLLHHPGGPQ